MKYMNRFHWIGQQQDNENNPEVYLLCKNELPNKMRCSHIYMKNAYADDTCPICGAYAAVDIYKDRKLESSLNENGLHKLFFERVPKVYEEMDTSIWSSLGDMAWKSASANEKVFLAFCMAFAEVSGEPTKSESDYWELALEAEARIRGYLVGKSIPVVKQDGCDLSLIADGMLAGREIRGLQSNYGISLCGEVFENQTRAECDRKYQKAIRIAERLAILGCSSRDNLPYFNAADHLAA
jgi:hypothetical protein